MALTSGQVQIAGTVPLVTVPAGASNVVLSSGGTIYVGSTAVTIASGFAVTSVPVSIETYPGSRGSTLYATPTPAGGTIAAFYMISTAG